METSQMEFYEQNWGLLAQSPKIVEWWQGSTHILDLAGIDDASVNALKKLKHRYDHKDAEGQSEVRGAMRFIEHGLTCDLFGDYLLSEMLLCLHDLFDGTTAKTDVARALRIWFAMRGKDSEELFEEIGVVWEMFLRKWQDEKGATT